MRPAFVIVALQVGDDAPGLEQVLEPVDAQTLLAQLAVEALHITILRRFPRLGVDQVDLPFQIPNPKVPTGQFWPVVAANRLGQTALSRAAYLLLLKLSQHKHRARCGTVSTLRIRQNAEKLFTWRNARGATGLN